VDRTDFADGEERKLYRQWRAGKPIADKYQQYFAALTPLEHKLLDDLVELHDERDREMRRARQNGITVIDNGQVLPPIVSTSTRPLARRRGAGRPAHRRTASSRAGPDDDPAEPAPPSWRRCVVAVGS